MKYKFILHCGRYENLDYMSANWPEYQPKSHPDKLMDRLNTYLAEFLRQEKDVVIACNSEVFFMALRVAIKDKIISYEDVEFHFHERDGNVRILKADSDARFELWPAGFFDETERLLSKLLTSKNVNENI